MTQLGYPCARSVQKSSQMRIHNAAYRLNVGNRPKQKSKASALSLKGHRHLAGPHVIEHITQSCRALN